MLNRTRFSNVEMKAEEAVRHLTACQSNIQQDPQNLALLGEENKLFQDCRRWNKARELFLQQKIKAQWLQRHDQPYKILPQLHKEQKEYNKSVHNQE